MPSIESSWSGATDVSHWPDTFKERGDDSRAEEVEFMEELVSVLRLGHFVSLSARDVALSQALNSDQLA